MIGHVFGSQSNATNACVEHACFESVNEKQYQNGRNIVNLDNVLTKSLR